MIFVHIYFENFRFKFSIIFSSAFSKVENSIILLFHFIFEITTFKFIIYKPLKLTRTKRVQTTSYIFSISHQKYHFPLYFIIS